MKKTMIVSALAAFLLTGLTGLQASELVKGEAAAKAKVEEFSAKEEFKTKEDLEKFHKEAAQDEKKVDDVTKVKELESKDQAAAKTKVKAFDKEAASDEKKTVK